MKDVWYNVIIILPALVLFLIFLLFEIIVFRRRLEGLKEFVVINVFSSITKEKPAVIITTSEVANNSEVIDLIKDRINHEKPRWLLKDIDITKRKDKIFKSLHVLFLAIFFICAMIFWSFLLLDISFSCDDEDNTKDCFEYMYNYWNSEAFKTLGRDPIDCNSAAVKNGTVQVVCYKIVFNYGLAAGASYGTFKFTMVGFNVATSVMTKYSERQTVCIKIIYGIVYLGIHGAIFAIQATCLRIFFMSSNLVTGFQMSAALLSTGTFLFFFPWKEIVADKKESQNAIIMQNPLTESERAEKV